MSVILYNIIISPLEFIIENLFSIFFQIIELDLISSIFFISLVVTLFSLPFYSRADKIHKEEEEKYSQIKPYADKIKSNFKGEEQFFLLQTLYRQHNYNPIMGLRNSFSLLLQIPIFIAAYHFFSNLELLNGSSFGIFKDFSQPDKLLYLGGVHINVLPIIMTLINIVSCKIYLKGKSFNEKIQPYSFAFIFLLLLYNSPSALVLYWTFNNFFYLLKNIFMDDNPKKFAMILLSLGLIVSSLGDYSWYADVEKIPVNLLKKIFPFLIIFLFINYWVQLKRIIPNYYVDSSKKLFGLIIGLSALCLILLHGIIIPVGLFISDLPSFAFGFENIKNLSNILIENLFSYSGLFLFWGFIIFYFIKNEYHIYYVLIYISIFFCSVLNYFNISKELGSISLDLIFDKSDAVQRSFGSLSSQISNILIMLLIIYFFAYLMKKVLMKPIIFIVLTFLLTETVVSAMFIFNFVKGIDYINEANEKSNLVGDYSNKIKLSKTGKNVIVMFFDRLPGFFLPMVFDEKPELKKSYSGFVFYPNTLSFYGATILGYPPCIGGYEYTPFVLEKDKRNFSEKWLESNLMLLTLFKKNNYSSTVVDSVLYFIDSFKREEEHLGSIYKSKGLNFVKMSGKYNAEFQKNKVNYSKLINRFRKKLYVYSYFCTVPSILKSFLYNDGYYLLARTKDNKDYFFEEKELLDAYSSLLYLVNNTTISSTENTFTLMNNQLSHCRFFLQYPNYEYVEKVTDIGPNRFNDKDTFKSYHTFMASVMLFAKFLDYLKEAGVYDNTRIIIVSDHGNRFVNLPQFNVFFNKNIAPFNPVLMVKDFNQKYELRVDNTFMTNADVPCIAVKDIIESPINPFTGKILSSNEKANGVDIYKNFYYWNPSDFTSNKVIIDEHPIINHVKDNIFVESNWERINYSEIR